MKLAKILSLAVFAAVSLGGCSDDAQVAKYNIAKAADNFEVNRRIMFYNVWKGESIVTVEGLCSIEYKSNRTFYICKTGPDSYINNFVGKSELVVAVVEQLDPLPTNVYHYRRTFKPQTVIPDIDLRVSGKALTKAIAPDTKD